MSDDFVENPILLPENPEIGQIAYEAYCEEIGWLSIKGEKLPKWDKVKKHVQIGWYKAAVAVAKYLKL
jgi:hypothetical protein